MLLLYLGILVLLTTIFCELAAKRAWLPYWVSRKILHIVAVGSCAIAGYFADSLGHRELLIWIVAGAEVVLLGLIGFGGLMREESGRKPWGIVWFPLAFLVLLMLEPKAEVVGFCMAVLAICDPAATIAGKLSQNLVINPKNYNTLDEKVVVGRRESSLWARTYSLTGDPKTLAGNVAFFCSFLALGWLFPFQTTEYVIYPPLSVLTSVTTYHLPWVTLVSLGILLAASEALGSQGADNLLVPLGCAVLMSSSVVLDGSYLLLFTLGMACLFTILTIRHGSLSPGGAITASLLGVLIIVSVGPVWLIPLFLFFLSSSLIGKMFPTIVAAGDAKQKQPRDATQVLANGGVYLLLAIWTYHYQSMDLLRVYTIPCELLLLTAAAVATADTWSSELGQYFHWPTFDLVKWRRVPAGLSGGVSLPGTVAGLAGAAFIAVWGFWLVDYAIPRDILQVTVMGFAGMLVDSILGSLLQATYRDPATGGLADVCPPGGQLVSGVRWMSNDLVNFLAILITVLLADEVFLFF